MPPGPLGPAIPYDSGPLPIECPCDLMEATYRRPPWLIGSYHPRHEMGTGHCFADGTLTINMTMAPTVQYCKVRLLAA